MLLVTGTTGIRDGPLKLETWTKQILSDKSPGPRGIMHVISVTLMWPYNLRWTNEMQVYNLYRFTEDYWVLIAPACAGAFSICMCLLGL